MPITRVLSVLLSRGRPSADRGHGSGGSLRRVDLELQTTKTLIEPRLELPVLGLGLPRRVWEDDSNEPALMTVHSSLGSQAASLLKHLQFPSLGLLYTV